MKILHVYHIYPNLFGGVSTVVYNLAMELTKRGHEISILTTDAYFNNANIIYNKQIHQNIKVYRFKIFSRKLLKHNIIIPSHRYLIWVKKNLRNYDCIHLHGGRTLDKIIIHHYAKKYGIPYILQMHGSILRIGRGKKLKWIYDKLFGYRILKDASKAIALTKMEAEQYKAMGVPEEKITIIPNGIDISEYANLPPKGLFRKKYNIPKDKKIILYVGRIHKSKGIDLLIKAYSYLVRKMKYKNAILVMVGPDDGYLQCVISLAKSLDVINSIIFTGFLSAKDKLSALVDAKLFVTPSFYGFPMTFLEACAVGKPIITTTLGDYLEWINENVGYVISPNPSSIANSIYKMLTDNYLYRKFSQNCRKIIESEFSIEKVVSKLEKVYCMLYS